MSDKSYRLAILVIGCGWPALILAITALFFALSTTSENEFGSNWYIDGEVLTTGEVLLLSFWPAVIYATLIAVVAAVAVSAIRFATR